MYELILIFRGNSWAQRGHAAYGWAAQGKSSLFSAMDEFKRGLDKFYGFSVKIFRMQAGF